MARKKRKSSEDEQPQKEQEIYTAARKHSKTSSRSSRPQDFTYVAAQGDLCDSSAPHPYNGFLPQPLQQPQAIPHRTPIDRVFNGVDTHNSCYDHHRQPRQQTNQMIPYSNDYQFHTYPSSSILPPSSTIFNHYQTSQPPILPSMTHQYHITECMNAQPGPVIDMGNDHNNNNHYLLPQPHQTSYSSTQINYPEAVSPLVAETTSEMNDSSSPTPVQAQPRRSDQELETEFQEYEWRLKATFEDIIGGRLNEACSKLRVNTRWLLTSVEELGLHLDSEALYPQRLLMWREFNHCWEALAQKQKDAFEDERCSNRRTNDRLSTQTIISMMSEFVSLADQIDRFGLIDKELGVWEEQIERAFRICLDQIEDIEKPNRGMASALVQA